jgi:hypothetical protein
MIILCFFIFSGVFLYFYVKEPEQLAKSSYTYYFLFLLVLLGIGYYFYKNPHRIQSMGSLVSHYPLFFTVLTCSILISCYSFYLFLSTTDSNTYYWTGKVVDTLSLLIIILVGISIVYSLFHSGNLAQRGWFGVVIEILLYLPCKFNEWLLWFLGQVNDTPKKVFFLLIFEFFLLIWFFNYQSILKWFSFGQQIFPIYNGTIALKNTTPIIGYSELSKQTGISNQTVPMNFGIAFWVYLNDNTQSLKEELPLFCYGGGVMDNSKETGKETEKEETSSPYGTKNVHPAITFIPTKHPTSQQLSENLWQGAGLTWSKGHVKIYFSQSSEQSIILDVPFQRWNLFTLNYTSQKADVFLNGELVASHTFSEPPVYSLGDSITVGGNGLQGAIQDVHYSVLPFSTNSIRSMYNNNMFITNVLPTYVTR